MEFTAHFGHILKQFNSGKTQSQCSKGGSWPHTIHRLSLHQKNLGPLRAALEGRSTVCLVANQKLFLRRRAEDGRA